MTSGFDEILKLADAIALHLIENDGKCKINFARRLHGLIVKERSKKINWQFELPHFS